MQNTPHSSNLVSIVVAVIGAAAVLVAAWIGTIGNSADATRLSIAATVTAEAKAASTSANLGPVSTPIPSTLPKTPLSTLVVTATSLPASVTSTAPITPVPLDPVPTSFATQIIVTGFGFAPDDVTNSAQRKRMALLAAEADAKRKLAEWLSGNQIDSITIVSHGLVVTDTIRSAINALIPLPTTMEQEYNAESGEAEVVLGLTLD